jgi:hypothetical protein
MRQGYSIIEGDSMTTQNLTPAEAFDQLRERGERGLPVSGSAHLSYLHGRGERFLYEGAVPDQSVAFPDRQVDVRAILSVVAASTGQLVLRLTTEWDSIYGHHTSIAEYVVTKIEDEVTVLPLWQQSTRRSADLADIDIHTGGVDPGDYHEETLSRLRSSGRPVVSMLHDGNNDREVDAQELAAIAQSVKDSVPLL